MDHTLSLLVSIISSIFLISILSAQVLEVKRFAERSDLFSSLAELKEKARILKYSSEGSFDRVRVFVPEDCFIFFDSKEDRIEIHQGENVEFLKFPGDIIYDLKVSGGMNEIELYFGVKEKEEKDNLTLIFK